MAGTSGGAVYGELGSSPLITGCTILGNAAEGDPTGSLGGGVYCRESCPTIISCVIVGNATTLHGGGVRLYGCSADVSNEDPKITDCVITLNTAGERGGGVACEGSSTMITNCTITANTAQVGGARTGCLTQLHNSQR